MTSSSPQSSSPPSSSTEQWTFEAFFKSVPSSSNPPGVDKTVDQEGQVAWPFSKRILGVWEGEDDIKSDKQFKKWMRLRGGWQKALKELNSGKDIEPVVREIMAELEHLAQWWEEVDQKAKESNGFRKKEAQEPSVLIRSRISRLGIEDYQACLFKNFEFLTPQDQYMRLRLAVEVSCQLHKPSQEDVYFNTNPGPVSLLKSVFEKAANGSPGGFGVPLRAWVGFGGKGLSIHKATLEESFKDAFDPLFFKSFTHWMENNNVHEQEVFDLFKPWVSHFKQLTGWTSLLPLWISLGQHLSWNLQQQWIDALDPTIVSVAPYGDLARHPVYHLNVGHGEALLRRFYEKGLDVSLEHYKILDVLDARHLASHRATGNWLDQKMKHQESFKEIKKSLMNPGTFLLTLYRVGGGIGSKIKTESHFLNGFLASEDFKKVLGDWLAKVNIRSKNNLNVEEVQDLLNFDWRPATQLGLFKTMLQTYPHEFACVLDWFMEDIKKWQPGGMSPKGALFFFNLILEEEVSTVKAMQGSVESSLMDRLLALMPEEVQAKCRQKWLEAIMLNNQTGLPGDKGDAAKRYSKSRL